MELFRSADIVVGVHRGSMMYDSNVSRVVAGVSEAVMQKSASERVESRPVSEGLQGLPFTAWGLSTQPARLIHPTASASSDSHKANFQHMFPTQPSSFQDSICIPCSSSPDPKP